MRLTGAEGVGGQETSGKGLRFGMFISDKALRVFCRGACCFRRVNLRVREGPCFLASLIWTSS